MDTYAISSFPFWKFSIGSFDFKELIDKGEEPKFWDCKVLTTYDNNYDYDWSNFINVVSSVIKQLPFKKDINLCFDRPWINIYKKDSYQEAHAHLNGQNVLSYCYFSKLPLGSGKFAFLTQEYDCYSYGDFKNVIDLEKLNIFEYVYPPVEEGDLLIFPSFLKHKVFLHKIDEPRITVSGNIRNIEQI